MAKKRSKLNANIKYELLGIFYVAVGCLSMADLCGLSAGMAGDFLAALQLYLFGIGAYLVPLVIIMIGLRYVWKHSPIVYTLRFFGITALYFSVLAIFHHFAIPPGREILPESLTAGGGLIGGGLLFILRKFFGIDGTIIILFAAVTGAVLLSTTWSLAAGLMKTKKQAAEKIHAAKDSIAATYEKVADTEPFNLDQVKEKFKGTFYNQEEDSQYDPLKEAATVPEALSPDKDTPEAAVFPIDFSVPAKEETGEPPSCAAPLPDPAKNAADLAFAADQGGVYQIPSFTTLLKKVGKVKNPKIAKEIAENAKILESTLESFNVKAKILNAANGPAVTRYELEPAPGVKVSKIVNLADDLALKLAAPGVRIEAPIPGKAAIGIEVPNRELSGVQLREVLENSDFSEMKSKLSVGLGMDIGGKAIVADLAKMPHLLVAGATGSGKSVCINTLITSVLFKARPDEVKFILIDPKMVELSNYNGIPHLMVPVVTDAKKAASVLNWAVQEMEKRYAMFAVHGVRDMERFNRGNEAEKMAAIVIIIDELADLMMVAPVDVEDAICRLAQKARAAGIHLVLATQRPSVDVITGIIKANVPSRISFSVSSQIDSRTILDMSGAEKLLGKGDMLYYPVGAAKPLRVQGAFISDGEVESLIEFIKAQGEKPEENEEIISFTEQAAAGKTPKPSESQDELLEDAVQLVLETGQASASMLQRRFRIGYTRAARLVDVMEEMRIIGPSLGSKAREIMMTREQVAHTYFQK